MPQKNIITILIIVIIVIAPASFYGGIKYAGKRATAAQDARGARFPGAGRQGAPGAMDANNRMRGGGLVNGEVLKIDDKSITVKLADGGSKTVYLSEATNINKFADGTKNDLQIGVNVMINGSANQDGSVMAQMVQIRPEEIKK